MVRLRTSLLLIPLLCTPGLACSPAPEAPTELSDLCAYLFREYENPDPRVRGAGMANLRDFFTDVDLEQSWQDLSYAVDDLTEADVVDVERPDVDPADTLPVAMVTGSAFSPVEHTAVVVLPDQTPVEPHSPNLYDRTFVEPTDPSCFPDRSCEVLRATNDIYRENAFVSLMHFTHKDFRWVELGAEEGSGEWGILARSWLPESAVGDSGNVQVTQNYSIDVFLPVDDGAVRFLALYAETHIDGIGEDTIEYTTRLGLHQMFDATEEYLVGAAVLGGGRAVSSANLDGTAYGDTLGAGGWVTAEGEFAGASALRGSDTVTITPPAVGVAGSGTGAMEFAGP